MMYKFFTNKHDLIDESWDELQNKLLEKILADESQDEKIENERVDESQERVQADDLYEKTETFQVSVQWESQADE